MTTQQIKAQIHKATDRIDDGLRATASHLGNDAEALAKERDVPQYKLRELGRRLVDNTRALADEAGKQAQLRPLAVFGIAFAAGVIIARLRRR